MKICLIRHGQVNHNLYGIYCNQDEDLNETSIQQALSLKEKIKDIQYDIIYSSPLTRAKYTAEIVNSAHKQILTDDRLIERNPGNLSGQPLKSLTETNTGITILKSIMEHLKGLFHFSIKYLTLSTL